MYFITIKQEPPQKNETALSKTKKNKNSFINRIPDFECKVPERLIFPVAE